MEVSLKQRRDEIPRQVEVCRGYVKHERELFERIASARGRFETSKDSNGKVAAENELAGLAWVAALGGAVLFIWGLPMELATWRAEPSERLTR